VKEVTNFGNFTKLPALNPSPCLLQLPPLFQKGPPYSSVLLLQDNNFVSVKHNPLLSLGYLLSALLSQGN